MSKQFIKLNNNIQNVSLQIGDEAFYVTALNGFASSPQSLGQVKEIGNDYIVVDPGVGFALNADDFIMFSKNKEANNNSLLGYYAEVKLINNSTDKIELFTLGSEVTESSK